MLTLRAGRQPQRRAGTAGRPARRASENATKVPLSKKCKLDIKRKHLRAAIPGCLAVNSFPVNLQLQIDGEKLPDLYKCTIKKHVNNKTSCVSYRLQGTGIYNHLRGLYMRGFSCGEEPGVVVLVASREAAPDLSYSGQSDGDDGDYAGDARVSGQGATDSEAEKRQRRQQRQQRSRKQQRKRRREDSDYSDDEEPQFQAAAIKEEAADMPLPGPSGNRALYPSHGHEMAAAVHQYHYPGHTHPYSHQNRHQRLRSHPVQAFEASPSGHDGIMDPHAVVHLLPGPGEDAAALLCHEPREDAVGTLDVVGVDDELVAAVAAAERRAAAQAVSGPGPSSSHDPFDQLTLGVGLGMGLSGVGTLGDGGGSLLNGGTAGHGCLVGNGLLGPDAGICSTVPNATLHDNVGIVCGGEGEGDGGGSHNAAAAQLGSSNFHAQRDTLLDLPISLSPFSPRLLQELTGRPHLPRVGGHQPPSQTNWGSMAPLDFDNSFNAWPRQHLNWSDSLSLGLL